MLYEDASGDSVQVEIGTAANLNHALRYRDGYLYFSSDTTVYRATYNGRNPLSAPQAIITGIPSGGHSTRTIEFGSNDNYIYVSVGSAGNIDTDSSRARVRRALLTSTFPISFSTMEVYADGLRNEVGLRMDPFNRLWGVENGVDNLDRFTTNPALHITNPAEEVNIFPPTGVGRHYGYPFCWSEGPGEGTALSFPGGLGAGTVWHDTRSSGSYNDTWCRSATVPSSFQLQAHSAPLDIFFDASGTIETGPVAIIPQHGSWNRPSDNRAGYRVEYLNLDASYNILGKETLVQFVQDGSTRPVAGVRSNCTAYGTCHFFTDDANNKIFVVAKIAGSNPAATPSSSQTPTAPQSYHVQVNSMLSFDWKIENDTLLTEIVHLGATGWFASGWNTQSVMSNVAVLATGQSSPQTGTVSLNNRNENSILGSWNGASSNWGYFNLSSRIENGNQYLSHSRPLVCPPGTEVNCFDIPLDGTEISFIFAYHDTNVADRSSVSMDQHSGTATYRIALSRNGQIPNNSNPSPASSAPTSYAVPSAFYLVVLLATVLAALC